MPVDDLIARLDHARKVGAGKWSARCPAHDDKDPSLSITETQDGRVLVHCFAGCGAHEILTAAGLPWETLFPPGAERYRPLIRRPKDEEHERAVLHICASDRMAGKRLSREEKERERQAWLRLHGGAA